MQSIKELPSIIIKVNLTCIKLDEIVDIIGTLGNTFMFAFFLTEFEVSQPMWGLQSHILCQCVRARGQRESGEHNIMLCNKSPIILTTLLFSMILLSTCVQPRPVKKCSSSNNVWFEPNQLQHKWKSALKCILQYAPTFDRVHTFEVALPLAWQP